MNKQVWHLTLLSVLILPIIPALAEVGIVVVLFLIFRQKFSQICSYPLNWAIGLVSLALVISTCFAANRPDAWLGLANLLPFLAMLAAYSQLFVTSLQLIELAWIIVMPSLPIVLLGWAQLYWGMSIPNILGLELISHGYPSGRMASVFMYANILAIYLLIVFCLNLGLWLENYHSWQKGNRNWRLPLLTIYLIAQMSGLILTSSRNAWLIACIACLIFALFLGWRWLVWMGIGIVSAISWAAKGPDPGRKFWRRYVPEYIWARLSDEMYSDRPIATLRQTQWKFSWELIQQRPWLGWGLRNFTILYKEQMQVWLGHPHNLFLMLMAETGIPITIGLCAIVAWILAKAILLINHLKQGKIILLTYVIAFTACILFNCLDVSLFDLKVNTLAWLLLSAIGGIVYNNSNKYLNPS